MVHGTSPNLMFIEGITMSASKKVMNGRLPFTQTVVYSNLKPLVMFFGLTNSPATFQTMMNEIFTDLILQGVMAIYINDILIYTKTKEEHNQITCLVLE